MTVPKPTTSAGSLYTGHVNSQCVRLLDMLNWVRGLGMLSGNEFQPPSQLRPRVAAMVGQVLVMRLYRDRNILTQICGNQILVLKLAPQLVVTEKQLDEFGEGAAGRQYLT